MSQTPRVLEVGCLVKSQRQPEVSTPLGAAGKRWYRLTTSETSFGEVRCNHTALPFRGIATQPQTPVSPVFGQVPRGNARIWPPITFTEMTKGLASGAGG
jgi:hypothetical protein